MFDGVIECNPCKICSPNASTTGSPCIAGTPVDTIQCTCNIGFYGDGVTCTQHPIPAVRTPAPISVSLSRFVTTASTAFTFTSDASVAVTMSFNTTWVTQGSGTMASLVINTVNPATTTAALATIAESTVLHTTPLNTEASIIVTSIHTSRNRTTTTTLDLIAGTTTPCASGSYGPGGAACIPCKICDDNASAIGACPAGSLVDSITCTCNVGYMGSGTTCTPCPTETWLLQFCTDTSATSITAALYTASGGDLAWCTQPTYLMCPATYPSWRMLYTAGDASVQALLQAPFVPATVGLALSAQVVEAMFRKNAVG